MEEHEREQYLAQAQALIPRSDQMEAFAQGLAQQGYCDAQLAPIWAEKLRHTYAAVLEIKYPELSAFNGGVLPIDRSIDPAMDTWEYFVVDHVGYADWIDDTGEIAPSSAVVGKRFTGSMYPIGHKWNATIFDLERAAKAGPLSPFISSKQEYARKAHARTTNWVWLFGDSNKNLLGLLNHPNIQVGFAPAAAGGGNSRKWEDGDKTEAEIGTDVALGINGIWNTTLGTYQCEKVLMGPRQWQYLNDTRPAGDRYASLLDLLMERYKGDPRSGQGKVEFGVLNECQNEYRRDPRTITKSPLDGGGGGTDTSGLTGDFLLFKPKVTKTEAHFVHPRRYTQVAPQNRDLSIIHNTHSKIGGCLLRVPNAFYRLDFGA